MRTNLTLRPMLATPAATLPVGSEWTYEVKWDGYRALAVKDGTRIRLISRKEKNLANAFPPLAAVIDGIGVPSAVLDGEIVAVDEQGRPSFQELQHRGSGKLTLVYYAFDVLGIGDASLLRLPLEKRREQLRTIVAGSGVLLSEPLPGSPSQIERQIRTFGLEGVVAKRKGSIYRPGERSDDWVKVRFSPQQEFVVGGYKPGGTTFESLLVGYYEGRKLLYAAKVRSGFTPHVKTEIRRRITASTRSTCPFVDLPNVGRSSHWGEGITADDMKTLRWVSPRLVAQVGFVEWTRDGLLRHPRFLGIRDDKMPEEVTREGGPASHGRRSD